MPDKQLKLIVLAVLAVLFTLLSVTKNVTAEYNDFYSVLAMLTWVFIILMPVKGE